MSGVTSTSFGLLIAYLLPGLVGLYGGSLWSEALATVFSTFLTAESNVALFLIVLLAGISVGILDQAIAWALLESLLFRRLFAKERQLLSVKFRGRVLFAGFRCEPFQRISQDDYERLWEPGRLPAYRAYIDEIYRYYQFWSGMVLMLPVVFAGWVVASEWNGMQNVLFALAAVIVELIAVLKCIDSWVGSHGAGLAILKEAIHGEEDRHEEEVRG